MPTGQDYVGHSYGISSASVVTNLFLVFIYNWVCMCALMFFYNLPFHLFYVVAFFRFGICLYVYHDISYFAARLLSCSQFCALKKKKATATS